MTKRSGSPRIVELAAHYRARAEGEALRLWRRRGGVGELRRAGRSITEITAALNAAGVRRPRGGRWHRTTVARVIRRAERLLEEHGVDAVLVTWEQLRYLRSAVEARREELRRLHPRHAAELAVLELPRPPAAGGGSEWVGLDLDGAAVDLLRQVAATEIDRVREAWRFAREDLERLERARRLWTRPHEIDPEGLEQALLQLEPDLDGVDLVDVDFAEVLVAWAGQSPAASGRASTKLEPRM